MNEEQTISSSCQQDIGSNGRKEDIICWYELLILHIHLSTADILPTIIMVFVVVCGLLPLVLRVVFHKTLNLYSRRPRTFSYFYCHISRT